MSIWDKIKNDVSSSRIPPFKSPEANDLKRWSTASTITEAAMMFPFVLWLIWHGSGYWEPRFIAYVCIGMMMVTTIIGMVLCKRVDNNAENISRMGAYKATLVALVILTFVMSCILTFRLS